MSDTSNPFASFFFANANSGMPQSTRQKIALAMMLQKRAFPKTLGEGLSSIGDSISDVMAMRQMGQEAAQTEKTNRAVEEGILGPSSSVPPPTASGPSPVQAAAIASGEQDPTSQMPVPPSSRPPAAPAVPLPLDQQQSYAPGAPIRMPSAEQTQDWRNQNPMQRGLPPVPGAVPTPQATPMPPPTARPSVADFGQKLALAPTPSPVAMAPPVVAEDAASLTPEAQQQRRDVALTMLRQRGQGGLPPPAPAPTPAPPAPVAPVINTAPPDQRVQIKKEPTYEADYVPPERPATPPPPTMTPRMQQIQDAIRNAAPGDREDLATRLKTPYENEVAKIKLAHEAYQSKLVEDRSYEQKRQELMATAAQRGATYEKTRHEINAGKIIQMEGRAFRVQDDGSLKDITPGQTGEGPPQIKMDQDQRDTLKFYKMGKTAAAQLEGKDELLAKGWADELAGRIPFAGNKLMSSQYRAAKNAAGLLVQADLRDTSGATIGTQEFADRFALLIPKSGDDPLAMRNKAEARRAVLEGQRLALGTARPMADYVDKEHAKERAEKAAKLNIEMSGKDKSKIYEKGDVHRKWNGSFWEEY